MVAAKDLQSAQAPALTDDASEDVILPPCDLESDEPTLETELHLRQLILLLSSLEWLWQDRDDFYASGNMTIYFSPKQIKSQDFRGPDFFVVLDTNRRVRKSWVVWEEDGKYPNVIIEVLSSSTASNDRGLKKQVYQDTFRTPEYFWFDPVSLEFAGFVLIAGEYEAIEPNPAGYRWSRQLGLFLGIYENQLYFFTAEGERVLTPPEAAKVAEQDAENAKQDAENARQDAENARQRERLLEERLRELGVDPEQI